VLASGARLTVNADGSYSYDPDGAFEFLGAGESALDSFTYVASDSQGGSDTATVTIAVSGVNDAPVAIDDEALTDEDHAVSGNVLRFDFDVDVGDTRLVGAVNGEAADVGATITLGSGALLTLLADGFFTYDPNGAFEFLRAGQVAADSFTYVAVDSQGALSNAATVTVTLVGNNDAPVATDDSVTTDEDVAILIDVLANDTDVEGDTLNVSGFTQGANGTVALVGGVLSYTSTANFHGIDSFQYTVSDGVGGSATGLVTVTINSVNDAPVATDDSATTDEDLPVLIEVLANDADVDGDTLAIASFSDGANGTVTQVGNDLRYTPNLDFNGSDSFTYSVSDGAGGTDTALVTITINAVNDAPVATVDSATTGEDVAVSIDVLANDADVDGDALTIDAFGQAANGTVAQVEGELLYTPDLNFHGTDSFEYTVSDGAGGSHTALVTISIVAVNDAPVLAPIGGQAVTEDSLLTFTATATDVDGDGLAFSVEGAPVGATIDALTGVFTWTPTSSQGPGSYAVTVRVTDNGTPPLEDFETFTILVNDAGGAGVDLIGTVDWDPADLLIQGDLEEAIVVVSNVGDAAAGEAVQVTLYASADGILDASDTVLATAQTAGGLAAGTSEALTLGFQLTTALLPGDYVLLAEVDSADQVVETDETNNVAAGEAFDFRWMFGAVPGHGQVTLLVDDADGTHALFALIGPGTGEITVDEAGEWDMIINGTRWYSIATVLTLGGGDQRIALGDIHVAGALGALIAPTMDLTGTLAIDGRVTFGIVIGSATQATITAPEILGWGLLGLGIQGIAVFGDLEDSQIMISEGDLGHLLVTGSMLSSEVSAEQGDIDSITILGEMSADSSIAAEDLPRYAWVDGERVATVSDPRFEEVSVDWSARWAGAMACLPFGRPGANFSDFARFAAKEAGRIRR
jgi:VCBS repeat-containing protein